jgi:uncharacterized protein
MTTKIELENALKDAMRSGDELRKRTLRLALSAIRMAEIDHRKPVEDAELMAILQKEVKSRHESIADAQRANRSDLIASYEDEIGVLEDYLPQPMAQAELDELVRQVITEVGATSARQMGQVMKLLLPRVQGRASGDQVSQAVKQQLV